LKVSSVYKRDIKRVDWNTLSPYTAMWHYGLVKDTDCGLNEWNLITTMFRIALESTWPPQGLSAP